MFILLTFEKYFTLKTVIKILREGLGMYYVLCIQKKHTMMCVFSRKLFFE